jgi:predicted nucleotidyltransferase
MDERYRQHGYRSGMTSGPGDRVLEVAEKEAESLVGMGGEAVYITGSHARGDAHPDSDIDIRVIGNGTSPDLKRKDEFLISTSWQTVDEAEGVLSDPAQVGEVIPGWRDAVILHDPNGIATELKKRAEKWDWEEISKECDEWVAEQVTEYAEEVHTLVGNLDQEQLSGAAAIRSQLALHLAQYLAVHRRVLYESENVLWEKVAEAMGEEYARNQSVALGLEAVSLEDSCRAALDLFGQAAADTADLLDETQREVVAYACKLAGHPLTG